MAQHVLLFTSIYIMEILYSSLLIGFFLVLIIAPITFFRIWDNARKGKSVFEFQTIDLEVHYPVGRIVAVVNDEVVLAQDERHLMLAQKAQATAKSDWAKWHWRVVEQRLLREMKWKATAALTNGSTFQNGVREFALHGPRQLRSLA
jgi:hypothetical protein